MAGDPKLLRCAIYTRKSTEHGLEQEFNSLDAQRDACEAYIRSQASHGWKALPQHYDDPAFSGGNLERPALKKLLVDIGAGRIDVVVVYKIDRLTRSLADFAKLVEAFDARSISFVAVTQQFNTTTSMGRLTAGSAARVPAQTVEQFIVHALRTRYPDLELSDAELLDRHLSRAVLDEHEIKLSLRLPDLAHSTRRGKTQPPDSEIRITWVQSGNSSGSFAQNGTCSSDRPDHKLIQALVRAHCWAHALVNADFASIEELAASIKLHPKVVRNDIRLAFLAPDIKDSILTTGCAFGLPNLRKISVLSWQKQLDEVNQ